MRPDSDFLMQLVTYRLDGTVAWIGLNRPAKRNAINGAMLQELEAAIGRAQDQALALVLFGDGPCFCAGLDLAQLGQPSPMAIYHHSREWHRVFAALRCGKIPAIAALHGATIGGGLELAAACHLRVADSSTFFALPEGRRGLYVGGGASVHVARLMGPSRMADLMLTGRVLDAASAERFGLVNYLVEEGAAAARAKELAEIVVRMAPLSVLAVLQALPRIQDMGAEEGLFVESLMSAMVASGQEAESRPADFVERGAAKVLGPDADRPPENPS
jgi:enoyl-CoA hydratase/carnithine racemase